LNLAWWKSGKHITSLSKSLRLIICRYDAIRIWNKSLKSPDSEYWVQLRPGTAVGELIAINIAPKFLVCAVIDNHRVLHGRSAFDGKRRMCGAYIGMDEFRSKLAVLSEKFAPETTLRATNGMPPTGLNERSVWNNAL
jgi:trimethyllysine dioxygenase